MREMMTESVRRDVCAAGIALLCEGGWEAFTTENIAKRLNVSRGVLYNYFKDKNGKNITLRAEGFLKDAEDIAISMKPAAL